jgi:hypothetical protein
MKHVLRAAASIAFGIAAAVLVLDRPTTDVDVIGGVVVAVALLIFIRAIMSLAGEPDDLGEQPPAPRETAD